jgi:hypothetical protein
MYPSAVKRFGFNSSIQWLSPAENQRRRRVGSNEWYAFRGRFMAKSCQAEKRELRIAVDSKYDLYINGDLVVREGGLKRGPTPSGTYYDTLDVTDFVREGANTFAILLWYFGRPGFSHNDSGTPGLLVDCDEGEFDAWRAVEHPSYFDAGYVQDAFRLPENSVGYDARQELTGWTSGDFDDSDWPEASPLASLGEMPWGELYRREVPQWFWSEPKEYVATEEHGSRNRDGFRYIRCDLPHNAQFIPTLEIEAKAGIRIAVTTGQDTNCLNSTYLTKDGLQSHVFPGWVNGETVTYKIPSSGVKVGALRYIETGYPAGFSGEFTSDDEILNRLWQKSRRTLYITMRDTFMDCPCRERAQWPGDMVVQLSQVPYCLDRSADLLVHKGLLETFRWQLDNGIIYGPVPAGNWRMELPAQMLSVISRYGIWTYYMNTGDRRLLEDVYPGMKRYLDIWKIKENGVIAYRPEAKGEEPVIVDGVAEGTWDWIDWGHKIDDEPALNGWFVLAADGVKKVARELGLEKDASEIGEKETRVREAIRKHYWNGEKGGFVSPGFEFAPDDRVQALMVLAGVAEPTQYPSLLNVFRTVEEACPYMEKYVLEALFAMGETGDALDRMKRRYYSLVSNENSTLWERWPEASDHPGTINHSWSGGPLTLLSGFVAGIRPLEPGWNQIMIQPRPGSLTRLDCSTKVPQGWIQFRADLVGNAWQIQLNIPEGCGATLDFSSFNPSESLRRLSGEGEELFFTIPLATASAAVD